MRSSAFVFTFLFAISLVSVLQSAICPEIICGKPQEFAPVRQLHGYREIDIKQLRKLLASEQSVLVLDARGEDQDDRRRLPRAKRFPYNTPDEDILSAIPKDAVVVIYCTNVKCSASRYLAQSMVRLGYRHILKYPDGLEGWVEAGQPVAMADKN